MFNKFINQKRIQILAIILSFSFLSPLSTHAIRIVLSGGGPAEMMALSTTRQMSSLLIMGANWAFTKNLITDSDKVKLLSFALSPEFRPGYFNIGFLNDDITEVPNTWPQMSLHLKRKDIYHEDGTPKSYQEIGYQVLMALIHSDAVKTQIIIHHLQHLNWESLAREIFQTITSSKEITQIATTGSESIQIEVLNAENHNRSYTSTNLYISHNRHISDMQFFNHSSSIWELTPDLLKALKCSETPQLTYIGQFQVQESLVIGRISWVCGSEHLGAKLTMPLAQLVNKETNVDYNFLMVKELPRPQGINCTKALE